ncbi:hypothetical protein T07_4765 [Trichinella nelsoni]|uniref:Uncharacterized protein n=1 Tax=Trichinella nelsoni TaxID=6336 RepID=A0A0V0SEB5_9BILA|nr:hypothetical protein T07_4765 [Trichinella nelsoni]
MTAVCLEAYLHWLAGWPSIAEIAKSESSPAAIQFAILGSIVVSIPACHAGDPGSIPGRGSQNIGRILGSMVLVTRGEITAKENKLKKLSSVEISISLDSNSSTDNVWLSGFAPITPLSKKGGDGGGTAIPFPINLGNCSIIGS